MSNPPSPVPQFNTTMPNLFIGLASIPTYDGTTSAEEFLNVLEETSILADWTDTQKISVARLKLRYRAKQYIESEPTLKTTTSWALLKDSLKTQFGRHYVKGTAMKQFIECKQRTGEACRQYLTRLKVLGHRTATLTGNPATDKLLEEKLLGDIATQFTLGLLMPIKQRVLSGNPATLDEALEIAEREESIENFLKPHSRECRGIMNKKKTAGPSRQNRWNQETPQARKMVCYNCNQEGHVRPNCPKLKDVNRQDNRGTLVCFRCHKEGHFAKNCRTEVGAFSQQSGNRQNLNSNAAPYQPRDVAANEASWD